jgi:hypothetical protein
MSGIKWGLRGSFHNRLMKSFIKFSVSLEMAHSFEGTRCKIPDGQDRQNEEMATGILEAN